jgi:hypothetical protein
MLGKIVAGLKRPFGHTNCSPEDTPIVPPKPSSLSTGGSQRIINIGVIVYSPNIGAQRLWEYLSWPDPYRLCEQTQAHFEQLQGGQVKFEQAVLWNIWDFPPFEGGERYDAPSYLRTLRDPGEIKRDRWGNRLQIDYQKALDEAEMTCYIANGQVDEVWLFGGPFFGFEECRWVDCIVPGGCERQKILVRGFNYRSLDDHSDIGN